MSKTLVLRSFVLAAAVATYSSATAISVSLDEPNAVFARPTSGSTVYGLNGVLSAGHRDFLEVFSESQAFTATGSFITGVPNPAARVSGQGTDYDAWTYRGALLFFTIGWNTPTGIYAFGSDLTSPAKMTVLYNNGFGSDFYITANYTVTVVQGVPEPASLAALSIGTLALIRRRKQA